MAGETLTLKLEGQVSLADFASAMGDFQALVDSLTQHIARGATIDWYIEELDSGSSLTTVAGESESRQALLSVVGGFETVGESLILQKEIPYPPSIRNNAKNLTNLINGNITEIVFQTANVDYVITAASLAGEEEPQKIYAYGAIKGWIQTLSMRRGLKFTLYDALYDKGVACYLKQGQEELVRNAWGYKTLVSGYITRDSTGKPLSIRDISTIEILPESDPEAWRRAAGVFPRGDEPAEVAVRRIRDA